MGWKRRNIYIYLYLYYSIFIYGILGGCFCFHFCLERGISDVSSRGALNFLSQVLG